MEEVAKVVFLTLSSNPERQTLSGRGLRRLWRIFISHEGKINLLTHPTWRSVLYVRKRVRTRGNRKQARRLTQDWAAVDGYLDAMHFSTFTKLKERCLYLDIDQRSAFFVPQLRVPNAVVSALLRLADSNIKDTMALRDSFRRSRTNSLSDDILNVMTRSQVLNELASGTWS
jgi:AbiV family abortive infection protein